MTDKFEKYERSQKPNWDKDKNWDKIKNKSNKNSKFLPLFWLMKYAAMATILMSGWLWAWIQSDKKELVTQLNSRVELRVDTVYLTNTIIDTVKEWKVTEKIIEREIIAEAPKRSKEDETPNFVVENKIIEKPIVEIKMDGQLASIIQPEPTSMVVSSVSEPLKKEEVVQKKRTYKVYGKNVNIGTNTSIGPLHSPIDFKFKPFETGLITYANN